MIISPRGDLRRLAEQESQQATSRFADRPVPMRLGAGMLHRLKANVGRNLPAVGEARRVAQRMNQAERGQQSDAWMRAQPSREVVTAIKSQLNHN